jgi:arylsulfatase A-like enzyme
MVDGEVGRIIQALEDARMLNDTLVIFTSDNGPTWYDADREKYGHDSSGSFRGMKGDAWEGGHRMPLIASWPGRIAPATTSKQTICFTDLLATFADLTETPLLKNAGPDSFSFYPVLIGEHPEHEPIRGPIVMAANQTMLIRSGDWKLIDSLRSGGFSRSAADGRGGAKGQLYNLKNDPGERNNLWLQYPERVATLSQKLEQIKQTPRTRP